jgi:uncharacterized protein GlcG (DUF336 family)
MEITKGLFVTALLALPVTLAAQLPTQKMLTVEVAQTIAHEALMACRAGGHRVTVTVVDQANMLKAFLRDDGAMFATIEVGRQKTNSVMAFNGRPSGPPANLTPGAPVPPPGLPGTSNAKGGLPIKAGDQLVGAVSVSGGGGGDGDVACANAGLAKVADKLK